MTISLYPSIVTDNDLSPDVGFGSEIDDACQTIHDATKGWGANFEKVKNELATRDGTERTKLALRYKEMFGKTLQEVMYKEFSGNHGVALQFLALRPDMAECAMLKKASEGIGAAGDVIWSILCGRTNSEMERIKKVYFDLYSRDLGKMLGKELHGDMERLIFTCLQAGEEEYDPQFHTAQKAQEDAQIIYAKGQGRWGTEERGIFKIICVSPPQHLENINKIYAEKHGYTLMKAMEKELGGNARDAAVFLVGMKLKPFETVAQLIKTACAGIGTDELLLTCCCIRYQIVMAHVMAAHIELFGKTVHERVRHECGGNYKAVLLAVLNTAWPEA